MFKRMIVIGLIVLFVVALWPPAGTLYEFTGEEQIQGQARGIIHWLNTAIRPQPHLAPEAELTHESISVFGANTFLQLEALPEVREESLRLLSEGGIDYIRQEFTWEDIEIHAKGDFGDRRNDYDGDGTVDEVDAWAKYDNIVDLAEQYDIEIIARLSNPPSWSRALPDEQIGANAPPDNYDDYGDFVAGVVGRYAGRVTYFQLWNEPNIYPEWGEQTVVPEDYADLLCTGYRRAKEANPEAVILSGALAPTVALSGRDLNDLIFLERMYSAGAGDCFDILSAQGYGLWSGPTDQRLRPTVINYPHNLLLRDVMVRHGDAHKPIWISEMAWNAVPDGIFAQYGQVTDAEKARYAVEAFKRAQAEWPWVGVVNYWFFKRPHDFEKDQAWYYFRLMEPDFTPLPAWDSLAEYASSDPVVESQGGWVYGWGSVRPGLALISGGILFFLLTRWLLEKNN